MITNRDFYGVSGPLLFLVYINDLPVKVKSQIRLFADDCYIYKVIYNTRDSIDIQNYVNSLICWEKQWSMEFHPDQCKLLRITNNSYPTETSYVMHKQKLDHVDEAKYLGILIHKKLSWKSHQFYYKESESN